MCNSNCGNCGSCNTVERKPHKHAAVIKAWADGAQIQVRPPASGRHEPHWLDMEPNEIPSWNINLEYRIKPPTQKYRLFLYEFTSGERWIRVANEGVSEKSVTGMGGFVKWLGDWQEVEI